MPTALFKSFLSLAVFFVLGLTSVQTPAAENDEGWHNPTIQNYGGVVKLDDASVPLDPARSYKLLFNVKQDAASPGSVVPGLERVARFLNLAALDGVPRENLDLAVVISGPATAAVLSPQAYQERFGRDNINLPLLQALQEAGLRILVCGQALAHRAFDMEEVTDGVEVAVAAMTVHAEFQLDGFLLMPE